MGDKEINDRANLQLDDELEFAQGDNSALNESDIKQLENLSI